MFFLGVVARQLSGCLGEMSEFGNTLDGPSSPICAVLQFPAQKYVCPATQLLHDASLELICACLRKS